MRTRRKVFTALAVAAIAVTVGFAAQQLNRLDAIDRIYKVTGERRFQLEVFRAIDASAGGAAAKNTAKTAWAEALVFHGGDVRGVYTSSTAQVRTVIADVARAEITKLRGAETSDVTKRWDEVTSGLVGP